MVFSLLAIMIAQSIPGQWGSSMLALCVIMTRIVMLKMSAIFSLSSVRTQFRYHCVDFGVLCILVNIIY